MKSNVFFPHHLKKCPPESGCICSSYGPSPKNVQTFCGSNWKHLGVSKNSGTPKSSILMWFSIINHPFWGTPIFGNTDLSFEGFVSRSKNILRFVAQFLVLSRGMIHHHKVGPYQLSIYRSPITSPCMKLWGHFFG